LESTGQQHRVWPKVQDMPCCAKRRHFAALGLAASCHSQLDVIPQQTDLVTQARLDRKISVAARGHWAPSNLVRTLAGLLDDGTDSVPPALEALRTLSNETCQVGSVNTSRPWSLPELCQYPRWRACASFEPQGGLRPHYQGIHSLRRSGSTTQCTRTTRRRRNTESINNHDFHMYPPASASHHSPLVSERPCLPTYDAEKATVRSHRPATVPTFPSVSLALRITIPHTKIVVSFFSRS